ncbi:SIS domain-containing protein [Paenibacillus agaridevorans]|uniref:SIS domain-containing protein n=1 Tax=Paenibacillus agaridevorans TaxID=171404 RepID=A0A2R5EIE5_9BACL|nr:SIS domain-containing protein [Paenibacillus agaridevorans]GBG05855.1 SIS domain-containing protein [Paenibacillus agaridevorans]
MTLMERYFDRMVELIANIRTTQRDRIEEAAERVADSIAGGGVLHVFGSGHSHMIAEDAFNRAGGLACVNAMLEDSLMELNVGRATLLERLPGYAEVLLTGYDLKPGETIVVVSNSGINAVPVQVAEACKKKGLHVVAITSMRHSTTTASRSPSAKKLYEIADIVLDNGGEPGDALLEYDGSGRKTGPSSTIGGILLIQALIVSVIDKLVARGIEPPVLASANRDGGDRHNEALLACYRSRIRYS